MRRIDRVSAALGFTLLEILVVLAISTTLLMLVVPNLSRSIAGAELPKVTKQLAVVLRRGRSQAINQSRPVSFVLDVNDRSYRLGAASKLHHLPGDIDLTMLTGMELAQGVGKGAIYFYPDGSSTGGRITLRHGDRSQQVDVNWLTGEVSVLSDV
ncbi:MAG: type II secretion system protein GspH [Gammaproteobacteria bacterium]|nr:MAG: type II secretion system protein GspH [Gammaproteobacteria bacterium]